MSDDHQVEIAVKPDGRRAAVVLTRQGMTLFADKCDPGSARSRAALLKSVEADIPGLADQLPEIERRILDLAASAASPEQASASSAIPPIPEPWETSVDGADLMDELRALLEKHVVLPPHAAIASALWLLHTYCYQLFEYSPRLLVHGPEKRCGKSLLMRLLSTLAAVPLKCENVTAAVLFRAIDAWHPTLLLDEADTYLSGPYVNEDLRGVINAGHQQGGNVMRCVGDDHEPRSFAVFGPMALSMIGKPPSTIEDRSVAIPMRRKKNGEKVERLPIGCDLRAEFEELVRQMVRWVQDNEHRIRQARPEIPLSLDDRAGDNWFALLALADVVGGLWPGLARAAAVALQGNRKAESDSLGVQLLAHLREAFKEMGIGRIPTVRLLGFLNKQEGWPWMDYQGRGLTAPQMARLLRPYEAFPVNIRIGDTKVAKGYTTAGLADAWDRYLDGSTNPGEAATPLQNPADADWREAGEETPE